MRVNKGSAIRTAPNRVREPVGAWRRHSSSKGLPHGIAELIEGALEEAGRWSPPRGRKPGGRRLMGQVLAPLSPRRIPWLPLLGSWRIHQEIINAWKSHFGC